MKKIFGDVKTFVISILGLIAGLLWAISSAWQWEPVLLIAISSVEIVSFIYIISGKLNDKQKINDNSFLINEDKKQGVSEAKKASTKILFIDDNHLDFKMVSILKKSGWINTKSVRDVLSLEDPKIIESEIIFVDINGVGSSLFQDQGLGLAAALKSKYTAKKVVLYSAEVTGDRFHKAIRSVDGCLSKNAEPYQFINLIEELVVQL